MMSLRQRETMCITADVQGSNLTAYCTTKWAEYPNCLSTWLILVCVYLIKPSVRANMRGNNVRICDMNLLSGQRRYWQLITRNSRSWVMIWTLERYRMRFRYHCSCGQARRMIWHEQKRESQVNSNDLRRRHTNRLRVWRRKARGLWWKGQVWRVMYYLLLGPWRENDTLMDGFENIKRGFALGGNNSGMVLIIKRLMHRWFSGSVVSGEDDVDIDDEAWPADKAGWLFECLCLGSRHRWRCVLWATDRVFAGRRRKVGVCPEIE